MPIKSDSRQLYLQVIDKIKHDIKTGTYKEKEKLPSEFQLAKQLGVSRATLREALRILEEENIIIRRHGVGTFINTKPIFSSGIEQLKSVTSMIEQSGRTAGTKYITTEKRKPTEEERKRFLSDNLQQIVEIERIRTADDEPVVFCIDQMPEKIIELQHIYNEASLFTILEKYTDYRIAYAVTYIEPISFNERVNRLLNCHTKQALLLLKQMHYTEKDEPILYSKNYFRSDMFTFHVLRKRV